MPNDIHQANRNQQIGNVCIQWSTLEYILAQCIWTMSGLDPEVGKILTGSMDAKQRANAGFAIAHEINAPPYLKKAFKDVLKALLNDDLINRRNRAVHGVHFPAEAPDRVMVEMHRGKGGRKPKEQIDSDLKELGDEIHSVVTALANAAARYARDLLAKLIGTQSATEQVASILSNTLRATADADTSSQSQ